MEVGNLLPLRTGQSCPPAGGEAGSAENGLPEAAWGSQTSVSDHGAQGGEEPLGRGQQVVQGTC